jgi:hypothetical protein
MKFLEEHKFSACISTERGSHSEYCDGLSEKPIDMIDRILQAMKTTQSPKIAEYPPSRRVTRKDPSPGHQASDTSYLRDSDALAGFDKHESNRSEGNEQM